MNTLKDTWNLEHCALSLTSQGLYEAPGHAFWIGVDRPTWDGALLPACKVAYGKIAAGMQMWSDDKHIRSAVGDPSKRRCLINGVFPTAAVSLAEATDKLRSVPCSASRGILAGLYSASDDGLRENNVQTIRALRSLEMRCRVLGTCASLRCATR